MVEIQKGQIEQLLNCRRVVLQEGNVANWYIAFPIH